jgi:hypothetical protein
MNWKRFKIGSKTITDYYFLVAKLDPKLDSWVPFMCGKLARCSF